MIASQSNANAQLEFKLKRANKIDRSVITSSGSGESLSLLSQDASKACSSLTDELPIDFQFRWKFRRRFQFSHERSQCYVRISRCHGRIIISDFEIDVIVFSLCIRGPDHILLAMCIVHVLQSDWCRWVLNDATLAAKDINTEVVAMLSLHYLCVVLDELVQSALTCSFADNANYVTRWFYISCQLWCW